MSSYGLYSAGSNQMTKISEMTVKWKKDGLQGFSTYPKSLFDSVAGSYAININNSDCVATYRYGTPYTVTVLGGSCDARNEETGQYLAGDEVRITAGTVSGLTFKKWLSDDVTISNPSSTTADFTMPAKNVNVRADYDAFTIEPSFTFISENQGRISFEMAAEPTDVPRLVTKEGDETNVVGGQYFSASGTSRTLLINNGTGAYNVPAGEYRVAAEFDGRVWSFSDPFVVNYTATPGKVLSGIAVTHEPDKTTYVHGDDFSRTGMVVTATYSDGSSAAVTEYTVPDCRKDNS